MFIRPNFTVLKLKQEVYRTKKIKSFLFEEEIILIDVFKDSSFEFGIRIKDEFREHIIVKTGIHTFDHTFSVRRIRFSKPMLNIKIFEDDTKKNYYQKEKICSLANNL